jgi:hypothetical protein
VLPLMISKLVVPGQRWLRSKPHVYHTKSANGTESIVRRIGRATRYKLDFQMGRSLSTRVKSKARHLTSARSRSVQDELTREGQVALC